MPKFSYQATDLTGKVNTGVIEARNQEALLQILRSRKLFPVKISEVGENKNPLTADISVSVFFNRVKKRDIMTFTHQLSTLVDAGLPIDRALGILGELEEKPVFKNILTQIRRSIQSGSSLADALARNPRLFSRLYINMVRAGEAGGVLELIFTRLADFLERAQEMRDSVVSAMVYPAILTGIGGTSVLLLVTLVLPKFQAIFRDLGEALPLSTQMLIMLSDFLRGYWWAILGVVILGVTAFRRWVATPEGRTGWDGAKLKIPLLGDLIRKIEIARFARTLSTLVSSGVPILQALSIVKDTLTNEVISAALISVHGGIKKGEGISDPLKESGVFPPLAIHMIRVGEETGRLEAMLEKVAKTYEYEVQSTIKRLLALVEPAMIVLMGIIVGFIVASIMLAVFQFSNMSP